MSGRPKAGIDFSGWSVTIFDGDKKIDKLLDAQGWKGFGVYFFLCQSAYKINGYFLEWGYDDSASTARRMGGFVGSDTVEETVRLCLRVGLFDQRLFDEWSILTSKGIQRRFWAAVSGRRAVPLYTEFWLLEKSETEGLDKVARFCDLQPTNADLQPTNGPKSKVKQSKGKERKEWARPRREEVAQFLVGRGWSTRKAERFFDTYDSAGWVDTKGNPVRNWRQKALFWEKDDDKEQPAKATPDVSSDAEKLDAMRRLYAHLTKEEDNAKK